MKLGKQADCGCNRQPEAKGSKLGLDELMIVNPPSGGTAGMFLGDDGTLYQVQGASDEEQLEGLGQFFLGEDGSLYRAESPRPTQPAEAAHAASSGVGADATAELDGYLLAADGTLYEVTE